MKNLIVGNNKVLLSETLFIPHGEVVLVSCPVTEEDQLNCRFEFNTDESDNVKKDSVSGKPRASLNVDYDGGIFVLRFTNIHKVSGHNFSKPVNFADADDGRKITILSRASRFSEVMQLQFQIMVEVEKK